MPELDKLIKMGELFEISLDELIKGEKPPYMAEAEAVSQETSSLSTCRRKWCRNEADTYRSPKKRLSWQKIAIIVLLVCGMFCPFIGTIYQPIYRRMDKPHSCRRPIHSDIASRDIALPSHKKLWPVNVRLGTMAAFLRLPALCHRYPFLVDSFCHGYT